MRGKTYCMMAGIIFTLVALFHVVRIYMEWPVMIGEWSAPKSVSWVAFIVAGGLALRGAAHHWTPSRTAAHILAPTKQSQRLSADFSRHDTVRVAQVSDR
jgi:hypothetical protein